MVSVQPLYIEDNGSDLGDDHYCDEVLYRLRLMNYKKVNEGNLQSTR